MSRSFACLLVLALSVAVLAPSAPASAADRPNIVLIIADDQGAEDLGCYGNKGIRTPNLDRLAADGMRFTRAFNACSSCSPSRSSIITGRYPHSTGAERLHMPLPREQVTFVEKLKAAGYWTAAAGKWHLGPAVKDRFDLVIEGAGTLPPDAARDGSGCEAWVPTLQGRPKDKPFFCWLAAMDPHRPYGKNATAQPHQPQDVTVPPYLPDNPETRGDLALYYDEIHRLDGYVGQVIAELQRQDVLENTMVVYITDNGRPFPRCKTTVYDSGVKTPLLIRWPARVKPGTVCDGLTSTVDLAPTFLDLAGIAEKPPTFQGKSFAGQLSDPTVGYREYVFHEHNWHDYTAFERAVRSTKYKYIRNAWPDLRGTPPADAVRSPTYAAMQKLHAEGKLSIEQQDPLLAPRPAEQLFDLETDPHELKNLANDPAHAAKLAELRKVLDGWQAETADAVPSTRPPDGFDRETGERLGGAGRRGRQTE